MYCLDTNTCVDWLKAREPSLLARARAVPISELRIPSMVRAELLYGAELCRQPALERREILAFLDHLGTLPFDDAAAAHYAQLRADLHRRGLMIGANDLVIAATALAHQAVLVTRNRREFSRVRGLLIEDWSQP
jgi:tRNA(fMet)-specific endonuclease VapC